MNLPLKGITILDLTRLLPGPYATMILGDLGAKIIRIEKPGDHLGDLPPYYQYRNKRMSIFNTIVMRNKYSIKLDLKEREARQVLYDLVKQADVFMEGFRPGIVKKLQIDYDTLNRINPKLIYCSLTGYGQTGPYAQKPGHDINFIGASGNLRTKPNRIPSTLEKREQNFQPRIPTIQMADIGGSLYAAIGIISALFRQVNNNDGKGEYIDIGMLDVAFSLNPWEAAFAMTNDGEENDLIHGRYPAYSIFETKDHKFMTIANVEPKFWNNFCRILNLPKLKRYAWAEGKRNKRAFKILQEMFLTHTQQEWINIFENENVCVMPVKSYLEAMQDPHLVAREMVFSENHPHAGSIRNIGCPIHFKQTPLKLRKHYPVPGEDTINILQYLGYSDDKIKNLKDKQCFG